MSAASKLVGQAQINEALALVIDANVREIAMREKLHDDHANLTADFAFEPIRTVNEADLRDAS